MRKTAATPRTLYTIGHSTRTTRELVELIRAHGVEQVVDVRTIPRSRHNPQFTRLALSHSLREARIGYRHLKALGGLRHARPDSINLGWRNASFRGYADYMQTGEFAHHVEALVRLAASTRLVLMCAEAVPWRCHRSLLSDALVVRGLDVLHITSSGPPSAHVLTSWAHRDGTRLTYPPVQGELAL
jgi:uncharacterized protein (DUF488 family)